MLSDTDKENFLIPTYQRGYKWTAFDGKGQVNVLMRDLYNAYKSRSSKYYLQFLTLKARGNELEVIDGQQRLTTLSILFCVIFHQLDDQSNNFVVSKLKFQSRHNFIEEYIYNDIDSLLKSPDWNVFIKDNVEHDNQDVFYIFSAARAINKFIEEHTLELDKFLYYIYSNVNLIINLLELELNSEKVFVNVNKGVKLNDEDLVKGLLITKLPIDLLNQKVRATEIEINELRTNLGRQWDDLTNWAYRKDIRSFFKSDTSSSSRLEWLIKLTYPDITEDSDEHPMFSYFDRLYSQHGIKAEEIFNSIRQTKMMLNDWFETPEVSNLLGFVLTAYEAPRKEILWKELRELDAKGEILAHLKAKCMRLLPLTDNQKLAELNYEDDGKKLFNVFLFLDIMKFLPITSNVASKYDFTRISDGDWSLEHIFPQNAKDFKSIESLSIDDVRIVKELIDNHIGNLHLDPSEAGKQVMIFYSKIMATDSDLKINSDDRELLVTLLKFNAPKLHAIGNLALMLSNMNSSLSNHFFDKKREIMVRKISQGDFVPYHTYDIFSKLIIKKVSSLHIWSKADIEEHTAYIENQINKIVEYLNPKA